MLPKDQAPLLAARAISHLGAGRLRSSPCTNRASVEPGTSPTTVNHHSRALSLDLLTMRFVRVRVAPDLGSVWRRVRR